MEGERKDSHLAHAPGLRAVRVDANLSRYVAVENVPMRAVRAINILGILATTSMVAGAMYIEFTRNEQPCQLCLLQRMCLLGIAIGGLMNLRFGVRPLHYGLSLLFVLMGGAVSLRQTFLHIVPGSPAGPSAPVAGYDLWWWAFLAFLVAGGCIALMLILEGDEERSGPTMDWLAQLLFGYVLIATALNVAIAVKLAGFGMWPG